MYKQNKAMKIIPPIILNNTVIEANTNAIPRYIGFRENLKIPPVTNFVACSGLNGFTVVLSFLKLTNRVKVKIFQGKKNSEFQFLGKFF
jgi:hypothetical protein